ncbi:hypothetical protein SELMODRAFT_422245 [Selaginella moellendorffii]|uniref:Uncharacterized protein n=1 Tax=Selaginella moellendorffii TaxID=88036 RepID=D8SHU8_SELML|nr:hypothetical protein SELMODRAFT_422245 [Selaginella moellendorffii]
MEVDQQGQRSSSGGLPLSFYIRSARLCLKKATLARLQPNSPESSGGSEEELQHLRRFEALVACALPAHKEYCERRGDKAVRELHVGLVEARRRIQELLEGVGEKSGKSQSQSQKKKAVSSSTSPTKKAASPKRAASPTKKAGSPKKLAGSSPKKSRPGSPRKLSSSSRAPSRPKAATTVEKKLSRPVKSPRETPLLKPQQQASKQTNAAKRAESPGKRRPGSPKKKTDHSPPSPPGENGGKLEFEETEATVDVSKLRKRPKGTALKDWEAKLHDVYTFADEKPPVYYLPKKLPSALQKNRRTVESSESGTAPPARLPASGVRDSTRSLPTGKSDKLFSDAADQRKERSGQFDLRKSYDDIGSARRDRHKLLDDTDEYYRSRTEESEPVLQRSRRNSGLKRGFLDRGSGNTREDRVWDNFVYEKSQKLDARAPPGKVSDDKSLSLSYDGADTSESRTVLYDESKNGNVKIVRDLRGSLDGFRIRLEEEGKRWRGRVNALEKEIEFLRDETEGDLVVLRRNVQEEAKKRENFSHKLVNSVDALEESIVKDMDGLRVEISKKGDRHWMENVIKETVEKCLSDRTETKEKPLKDELRLLKAEVELLSRGRVELESHFEQIAQIVENDRETISTEQINIRTENGYLRKQLQSMKKEGLQARVEADEFRKGCESDMDELKHVLGKLKDEAMQMKIDFQGLKGLEETFKVDRGSMRRSADRIRDEASQEKMLIMDRVENLSKLYLGGLDEVRMDVLNVKIKCQDKVEELEDQLREFKQRQESVPCSRSSSRGAASFEEVESRMAHLESKQELMHMAGLEESRMALFNLDMKCQDKIEAIEQQLKEVRRRSIDSPAASRNTSRDIMIDDLESRLSSMERKQDTHRYMLEDAVAIAEKEKRLASAAASDAAAAAIKAEEALSEVLKHSDDSLTSSRYRRTGRLQESLAMERDSFSAAACELRRTSIDMTRETESAVEAAAEAKRRAEELQERLRDAVCEVDRQRSMAAEFAAKASSVSSEARDLLDEMAGMRKTLAENTSSDHMDSDRTHETAKLLTDLEKRMDALEQSSRSKSAAPVEKEKVAKSQVKGKLSSTTKRRLENEELRLDTRVTSLESHLEHVASATYANIRYEKEQSSLFLCKNLTSSSNRMLDTKVEHVSVSAQSALEGASVAERKCGALGAELVKVFRVLASFKKDNSERQSSITKSKESSSPVRRPHFACDSCKRAASTILHGSLEFLPSSEVVKAREVKKTNLRLSTSDSKSLEMAVREEADECLVHGRKIQERIAKVEESIQNYGSTRRSWGTSVATLLAEEDGSKGLEDMNSWGISSRGICVTQEPELC